LTSGPVVRPADSKEDLTNNTEIKMIIDNIFNHEINKIFQIEKDIPSSTFRDLICAYFNEHHTPLQYGGEHSSKFIKFFIVNNMCVEKTENVSVTSLRHWLSEAVRKIKRGNFCEIFKGILDLEIGKTAQSLYNQGKRAYGRTGGSDKEKHLDQAREMFEIYHALIEAKFDVGRAPSEDRHLFYLMKLDDNPETSVSKWKEHWKKWKEQYGTLEPHEQHGRHGEDMRTSRSSNFYSSSSSDLHSFT